MNSPELKNYLKLCRRLGIRYISTASVKEPDLEPKAAAPVSAPALAMDPPPVSAAAASVPASWMTGPSVDSDRARLLADFDSKICLCQKCPLGKTRQRFVFGSGNPTAEVMFVGEAPGADEDAQGLPFVGKAGQLLTKIIESTKAFKREDVFIANVLKCRPPGNRAPLPEEVEQCRPYLEEQIQIIKPRLIMALGASAAQALLRSTEPVGKLRQKWHEVAGIPLRVTYHPAALLRFEGYKKDVWADMKEFTAKYLETPEKQQ